MSHSSDDVDRDTFLSILCMAVVIIFAAIGGFLMSLLGGYKFPKFLHRFGLVKWKPVFKSFKLPQLLGEIIFGIIARNSFTDFMEDYNPKWGEYSRMICLTVLLLAGGMHLDFKGKGLVVLLLVLFSPCVEAVAIGVLAFLCLGMSLPLGLALGFTIAAVSPAVLVPPLLQLQMEGYGISNGIPTTLIAASSFEDVTVIIFYGIFSTIALNSIKEEEEPVGKVLFKIGYELAAGVAAGALIGFFMRYLKNLSIKIKFVISLFIAIGMVLTFELTGLHESKYLSIIIFGYMCRQGWGHDRPDHYLNVLFSYITPFLFGTVGAAMVFAEIDTSVLGYAFLIIIVGVFFRWSSTVLSTLQKKYSWGEKIFMACAWIPKATVQAALGGNILEKAKEEKHEEYIDYGNKILTISILCILLTSPPCAIATLSFIFQFENVIINKVLGKKFLPRKKTLYESEEEGFVMDEKDETIINEVLNQEIPGVEISDSVKSKLQLSVAKSRMRRARMRNLVQNPESPGVRYILATHKVPDQENAIPEENEFGIDFQAEQNRPRIKSGEAQPQQKLSTADQGNSEEDGSPTKQHSRRNSMVSISRHGSQQSMSSIGFSIGDIQEQQLEQIHQINQKWKEQKIKHMQNGNKAEESQSYDTWERSFEDLQNKQVNESDAEDIRLQESQQDDEERKFSEHQVSEMEMQQMQQSGGSEEEESIPTESAQLNPRENFDIKKK